MLTSPLDTFLARPVPPKRTTFETIDASGVDITIRSRLQRKKGVARPSRPDFKAHRRQYLGVTVRPRRPDYFLVQTHTSLP